MSTKTLSTLGYYFGLLPLGLAFLGLSATVIGARWVAQRDAAEETASTQDEARHVAAQLSVGLSEAFNGLDKVAQWWLLQGRPMTPADWSTDAQLFTTSHAGLWRLIWLDLRGRPTWSARPGAVPDVRVELDPAMIPAFVRAHKTQETALAPADGGAFYVCEPVFHDGRLKGYLVGLYDTAQLVRSVLESQLPAAYSVSVGFNAQTVRVSGPEARASSQRARAEIAGQRWWVSLSPAHPGPTPLRQAVLTFGVLASALMYLSASSARAARRRARQIADLNRDLQRHLAEFHTLLDVLPVGIAVAEDAECRQIWANPALATMLDVPLEGNVSHSAAGGAPPPNYRMLRDGIAVPAQELPMQTAVRTGGAVRDAYLDLVRHDGVVLHTLNYAAPLFDEGGRVRGVIGACVDITSRRDLESRLQQAEKYQSLALMAGGIAHDFNNLLTVIIGNANTAAAELLPATRAADSVREIEAAALRAAELVGQLLAYTGQFWRVKSPILLSKEIELAAPELLVMVPPAIDIRFRLEPDLPPVEAGESELRQVLRYLTANSVEALESVEKGRIEIAASRCELTAEEIGARYGDGDLRPGTFVRLEVRDNGCGIAPEIQPRVFDPFFTTKFVGRGLGLSAVLGIVRAHGGAVRLSSSADGTRVEVVLPACELPTAA